MMKKEQTEYIIVFQDKFGFKSHSVTTKERLLDNLIYCKEKLSELWAELPEVDILKNCSCFDLARYFYKSSEIVYFSQV